MSPQTFPIWPGVAPGAEDAAYEEERFAAPDGGEVVRNVVVPTLTAYLPAAGTATGTGVIVAPGGGFFVLGMDHEGRDAAAWLASRGIAAFLLKYRLVGSTAPLEQFQQDVDAFFADLFARRPDGLIQPEDLPPGMHDAAIADAAQAVRLLRSRGAEWGLRAGRLGFLGFSAGGLLATEIAVLPDRSGRPDFIAPIYGSYLDHEIPADAPPMFNAVCADDAICYAMSMRAFTCWRAAGRPAEMHVFNSGGHGFGMRKQGVSVDTWTDRFTDWMSDLGFLP